MDDADIARPPRWRPLFHAALALWFIALVVISAAGVGFLIYNHRYAGRIYQGVYIAGLPVGGLERQEALRVLHEQLRSDRLPPAVLYTADQEWLTVASHLGAEFALDEAVAQAWALGRGGVFREDMGVRLRLLWQGYNIMPAVRFDPGKMLLALRGIARQTGHPAQRARLWVAGLQAHVGRSEVGREMDIPATQARLEAAYREGLAQSAWRATPRFLEALSSTVTAEAPWPTDPLRVPIAFQEITPPITEVQGAQERVQALLQAPLTLRADLPEILPDGHVETITRRWSVDQATLSEWLTLEQVVAESKPALQVRVDRETIRAYLARLGEEVARAPREGRFDYDPKAQKLSVLAPGQNGFSLDVEEATRRVAEACFTPQREVTLPITVIPPRVTYADLQAIMPLELISEGESGFAGSTAARLQNIKVATARFHGLAVPPNSTFSFLSHLGLVTTANGYSESWIIYGGRTLLGPGGGVCQVGTTFFRAAFWGGYPILERSPHAYRVSWYEPPVGLDAAVFQPSVDVKFENDTPTPILILTEVNEATSKLYFRFYGKRPGRRVTIEGPIVENPVKAPDPVYEEDPFLAPGQRIQVEWAHDGADVTVYRIIEENGRVVARERFFSRYRPWPARYRVGPQAAPATGSP